MMLDLWREDIMTQKETFSVGINTCMEQFFLLLSGF